MAGIAEAGDQRREAGIGIEHHHITARHRAVAGAGIAQVQHVAHHGAFHRAEIVAALAIGRRVFGFVDRLFQAFA